MNKTNTAIIIVNWNGKKFLKDCLNSVKNQSYKNFEIFLVDNGSSDGSIEYIKENFPEVNLIPLKENTGFAKGNNIGIKKAMKNKEIKYIVLLNNDTIVDKDWLKEGLKTLKKENEIYASVQSKVILFKEKKIHTIGMKINRDLTTYSKNFLENPNLFNEEIEIFAPIGCAAFYKIEALKKIMNITGEIFDSTYFCYREDDQLGWNLQFLGYKSKFSPNSIVYHIHSGSSGIGSDFKIYHTERNRMYNVIKFMPIKEIILNPIFYIKRIFKDYKKLDEYEKNKKTQKKNKFKILLLLIRANGDFLIHLPEMIKKRNKIMQNKKISNKKIINIINKFSK